MSSIYFWRAIRAKQFTVSLRCLNYASNQLFLKQTCLVHTTLKIATCKASLQTTSLISLRKFTCWQQWWLTVIFLFTVFTGDNVTTTKSGDKATAIDRSNCYGFYHGYNAYTPDYYARWHFTWRNCLRFFLFFFFFFGGGGGGGGSF